MTLESSGWGNGSVIRVFAGVCLGARSGRLKAAILRCRGEGWHLRVLHTDGMTFPTPPNNEDELSRAVIQAVMMLANQAGVPLPAIDCIGIADLPGDMLRIGTHVAERSGVTVVTRFADRDRVVGGAGEPLSPTADWLLFRSHRQTRLLVSLGPSLRVTLLMAGRSHEEIVCFDAGPGTAFLDELTRHLSNGRFQFDPSGHFAVQGRHSEVLLSHWTSHPFLLKQPPRFVNRETFDAGFIESSVSFARETGLSAKDVLCTANHFVAKSLREANQRFLPTRVPVSGVITSGGGIHNGLLWKLIGDAFGPVAVERTDDLGVPSEVLAAAHAALLAYMTMENLPGNVPGITGASAPRVLGTVIPGSQSSWDRWVCNLADRLELESRRAA